MQTEIVTQTGTRPLIPLAYANEGETVTVKKIIGGIGVNKRLAEMGLVPDTEITIITNHRPGGVLLQVKDSKLCLGEGVAYKIQVETR